MNLKTLNDSVLIQASEKLVAQERELLTQFLHHLREINARRLFSSMGYKSLFDFAVKHYHYSEDQAYRRIAAMKLLTELPEIELKINQGEISLSHLGLAQTFFNQEKKISEELTHSQKLSVLEKIANTTTREAEKITLSLSSEPAALKPDRVSLASDKTIEIKFSASVDLSEKIGKLKGLLAHRAPNISLGELFEKLCDIGLTEWDPSKSKVEKKVLKKELVKPEEAVGAPKKIAAPRNRCVNVPKRALNYEPKQISKAELRRQVFLRAANQCESCGSSFALEVDHIRPRALGGDSEISNLRLLCRSCNQRAAIRNLGQLKMDAFLN